MTRRYTCTYQQIFNVFGAPGIPNEYQATLYRGAEVVEERTFWWRKKAENQCIRWRNLYDARIDLP